MELPRATDLPNVAKVRQRYPTDHIDDVEGAARAQVRKLNLGDRIGGGKRVGITAGSRGMGGLVACLRGVIAAVREAGGEPYIIPAMGSHGGATPEGQKHILALLGVTEEALGVAIQPTMETVVLGTGSNGYTAHYDAAAARDGAVIVLGRTQVHPNLKAGQKSDGVASGLLKMVMIGLGKQSGAQSAHHHGLAESILEVPKFLPKTNIVAGVAVVENAYRQPHTIEAVPPGEFKACDQRLLKVAESLLGQIPFEELDVLVADKMGKTVAGSGLDPNVIGFWRLEGGPKKPNYRRIVSLDLTDGSGGNATGIGLNDFITERLFAKMDRHATYINLLTAANKDNRTLEAYVPFIAKDDREALQLAVESVMPCPKPRICHIHDTASLAELMVSEALLPEVKQNPKLELASELQPLRFDKEGQLAWV